MAARAQTASSPTSQGNLGQSRYEIGDEVIGDRFAGVVHRNTELFRPRQNPAVEDGPPESLEGGEKEKDGADNDGGGDHLLPGKRPGVPVGKGPHRKGRGGLDAHQGEHVGHDHQPGPGTSGAVPEQGAGPFEKGVGVRPRRNGDHVAALAGETGEAALEVRPAADEVEGDEAEDDDAEGEQDALGAVDVGDRAQAA